MNYSPSDALLEKQRHLFQRRVGDALFAVLGNHDGAGARVDVPGLLGYVYIRFPYGKDGNGDVLYTPPTMAWAGDAAYINAPGAGVYVRYGDEGELEIKGAHKRGLALMGVDARVLNPLNQQSKFVYPWQLTYGLANAVGNSVEASFLVTVKQFWHYTGDTFASFDTPLEADKPSLESYAPSAGEHRYAMIWVDTYTNAATVTTSTAQPITNALDITDIQELVADRPPDAMPFKAFYLMDDQSSLRQTAKEVDLRQHMALPMILGFPQDLQTLERVRPNRTFLLPGDVDDNGNITLETGARLLRVHKSNVSASAPTVNDDSGDGYSVGSLWFDSATNIFYVATDITVGAAIWAAIVSGGAMTSWTLAGDGGTPQTITNGNTATIAGGTAITTTASATDTLTIDLDNTAVTPGSYTLTNLTVDAQGRITAASNGSAGTMSSFSVSGDSGTPQTISDGNTLNIAGGTALTSVASATDTLTINLDNTAVTPASYTNTNLTVDAQGRITAASDGTAPVNPPFVDTQTIIKGSADATKLLRFEVDGFTTGTTRVLTPPNADAEIVGRTTTQILTGKTIDGDDNTLQDIPLTAIKTVGANTDRFVTRNSSGVITDAVQPSFVNALHDHTNAANGSQLPLAALLQDGAATGQFLKWSGAAWVPSNLPNLIAILRDEKTSGTNGGTSSNTTWNARDLNTELYDPGSIVSISSNQFTPIAGDYEITVFTPFIGGTAALSLGRCRLYNVTAAAAVEEGMSTFAVISAPGIAVLTCKFTANGTDAYRIDTYTSVGRATTGLGAQVGDGSAEVYTNLILRKLP